MRRWPVPGRPTRARPRREHHAGFDESSRVVGAGHHARTPDPVWSAYVCVISTASIWAGCIPARPRRSNAPPPRSTSKRGCPSTRSTYEEDARCGGTKGPPLPRTASSRLLMPVPTLPKQAGHGHGGKISALLTHGEGTVGASNGAAMGRSRPRGKPGRKRSSPVRAFGSSPRFRQRQRPCSGAPPRNQSWKSWARITGSSRK